MRLVATLAELEANVETLRAYLRSGSDAEQAFAKELVKRGLNFVVAGAGESVVFAPSRFVGYAGNAMSTHQENEAKDGRETTPRIAALLGGEPSADGNLEEEFRQYSQRLMIAVSDRSVFGLRRKFWRMGYGVRPRLMEVARPR